MDESLATVLETVADELGDSVAMVQGMRRRTWSEFGDRAARLATALAERGITSGSRVGVGLWSSPEYLESVAAICKLDAVPFNVNYRYRVAELEHVLADADARGLVFDAATGGVVAEATARRPGMRALLRVGPVPAGEKVQPEELEQVLLDLPEVRDVVVVGVPDDRFGQRIAAVLALADGAQLTAEQVREAVGARLANYKKPRDIVVVAHGRRSPAGKADLAWAGRVARGETPADG